MVLSLIEIVTIINYLDRGTLNYMWVANTKHVVAADAYSYDEQTACYHFELEGTAVSVPQAQVALQADGSLEYTEYGGIAKDLGLIDLSASQEQQQRQAKGMLAVITTFFMIAYGISQLVSGKIYDKIGTRKGFSDFECEILDAIENGSTTLAQIENTISFDPSRLTAILGMLELKGVIRKGFNQKYMIL